LTKSDYCVSVDYSNSLIVLDVIRPADCL
jgi:hypothetical protein